MFLIFLKAVDNDEELQIIKNSIDEWKSTLSNDVIAKNIVRETNM